MEQELSIDEIRHEVQKLVQHLLDVAKARASAWGALHKEATQLAKPTGLEDLLALEKASARLRASSLEESGELSTRLDQLISHKEKEQRFKLGGEVLLALQESQFEARPLGGEPPRYQAGMAVVELAFDKGRAVISYAREPIGEAPLVASRIVETCIKELGQLQKSSQPPETLHALLLKSYRAVLARDGLAFGERVEAVCLIPEVALSLQGRNFMSNPTKEAFSSYPRAQFAYDLAAMKRKGLLSIDQLRLDIGPATMGATAKKNRVLWIETSPGAGQYYGSLRFVREGGA